MTSLDKVCCIVDVDGFDIRVSVNCGLSYRNKFLIRELGYIRIDPKHEFQANSFRFDLRKEINMKTISGNVLRTLRYQSKEVIGLSVLPNRDEVVKDYGELESVVQDMYRTCRQPGLDLVAYKGGCREKELLDSLGIPALDLGLYGCNTYQYLVKEKKVHSTLRDCGHHVGGRDPVHCPMAEVTAFRDWYMVNYQRYSGAGSEDDSSSSSDDD